MVPLKDDKRQPPEFLFKDYHDATVGSEDDPSPPATAGIQTTPISGRKTRNSNGSRGGSLRPGLRSAKPNFFKSDTDEDDGKNDVKIMHWPNYNNDAILLLYLKILICCEEISLRKKKLNITIEI